MKLERLFLSSLICVFLVSEAPGAQSVNSLAARLYVDAHGNTMPYRLWVPPNYVATTLYPLVMYLHGSGGLGTDNLLPLLDPSPLVFISDTNQVRHPCLMIAPQCPDGSSWETPLIQQLVWGILTSLRSEFNLDPDRFYITGVSMGGFGTWSTISAFPDTFAAAVAMCGYAPSGFDPAFNRLAVWYFHAKDDATVDIAGGRAMIKAMRETGGTPIYTEYASGGHSIWTAVYATPPLVDWVMAQRRGQASPIPPLASLLTPAMPSPFSTAAASLDFSGLATNLNTNVTGVTWTNSLGGGGTAVGTSVWSIAALPLRLGTNILTILAAGISWASFGGSTTFNTGLTVVREPGIVATLTASGLTGTLAWSGGVPPFRIESTTSLVPAGWLPVLTNTTRTATFPMNGLQGSFRIMGQ